MVKVVNKNDETKMIDKIFEMKRKCFPIKDIARAICKRDRYVSEIIKKNGWCDIGVKQVLQLRAEGSSIKAIAKKLRISDRIVSLVLVKFNKY